MPPWRPGWPFIKGRPVHAPQNHHRLHRLCILVAWRVCSVPISDQNRCVVPLATQAETVELENSDRSSRFRRLAPSATATGKDIANVDPRSVLTPFENVAATPKIPSLSIPVVLRQDPVPTIRELAVPVIAVPRQPEMVTPAPLGKPNRF